MNIFWNEKINIFKTYEIIDLAELYMKYLTTIEKWGIRDDHMK